MRTRRFKQVDVFTATPYLGNPVAVVLDADGLDDQAMQRFARWTNLSETTFVQAPTEAERQAGADYRVRIFTPGGELPFAGHPTLGTCHAWLEAGGKPGDAQEVVQACAVGLIRVRRDEQRLAFAAPALKRKDASAGLLSKLANALNLQESQVVAAQMLDNGPVWVGLLVDRRDTVHQLQPDHARLKALGHKVGVAHFDAGAPVGTPALTVRGFAAPIGVDEDPVTGSLNASLAQWLMAEGRAPKHYMATQGAALGRDGRVFLDTDDKGQVWVGGQSLTCISGEVQL